MSSAHITQYHKKWFADDRTRGDNQTSTDRPSRTHRQLSVTTSLLTWPSRSRPVPVSKWFSRAAQVSGSSTMKVERRALIENPNHRSFPLHIIGSAQFVLNTAHPSNGGRQVKRRRWVRHVIDAKRMRKVRRWRSHIRWHRAWP